MASSRAQRRESRRPRVVAALGDDRADSALDLLELVELAWHDCYGEITLPDEIIDDVLLLSGGTLRGLVSAAHLAVTDWRDLKVAAQARSASGCRAIRRHAGALPVTADLRREASHHAPARSHIDAPRPLTLRNTGSVRTYAVRLSDGEFGPEFNSSAEAGMWARENLMSDDDRRGSWEIVYLREGQVVGSCMHITFRT